MCSVASDSVTSRTAAYQAPQSTGFSRQEYWSGVPSPSPRAYHTLAANPKGKGHHPYFIDKKTKTQESSVAFPRLFG